MTKPEEKKAIPESDNSTDRRIKLDRRIGPIDRRMNPDRRSSITDSISDNPNDRRTLPDRRCGITDRRKQNRRSSITDSVTDYRIRQIEGDNRSQNTTRSKESKPKG